MIDFICMGFMVGIIMLWAVAFTIISMFFLEVFWHKWTGRVVS